VLECLTAVCCMQEFSQLYIINAEDMLGSGQFGIVYGGKLQLSCLLSC